MARKDHTRLAILGILAYEPSSGYGIRESITETLGHFWSESFGQIYPALAELETEGLVDLVDETARRKTFGITNDGLTELRRLLVAPIAASRPRDPVLLRLFFGRHIPGDVQVEILDEAEQLALDQQVHLDSVAADLEERFAGSDDLAFWLLTIRQGQLAAGARLTWISEARRMLAEVKP